MASSIYALLIACDFYFPNITENETTFHSLSGCLRDITRVEEELLKGRLNVPPGNILKLKSSNIGKSAPPEPESELPTYENIIGKFQELTKLARSGDQVYIHYSGHGGRASTNFAELKGTTGVDETLVPINIEDVASRYVRDVELAKIFKVMVDKGLFLTVVLDSCHSGGMTRGGTMVRGAGKVDKRSRPGESLVAERKELIRTWQELRSSSTRGVQNDPGWLPEPKGYVLLAACRQDERAVEYKFNGTERYGALTYWLLEVLKNTESHITWKQIYDRLFSRITTQFKQTPQLQGETERVVFGVREVPQQYGVAVLQYDPQGNRVKLNTGEALGINAGARFAVYPSGTKDFTGKHERIVIVEITEPGSVNSWAKIIRTLNRPQFYGGEQAVLIDSGKAAGGGGQVYLIREFSSASEEDGREQAINSVSEAISSQGKGFLKTTATSDTSNFQVAVNADRNFEILDRLGKPFPNLRPEVSIDETNGGGKIVEKLIHLTKYQNIRSLKSPEVLSPLSGKLSAEMFAASADSRSDQEPLDPQPLPVIDGFPTIKAGEKLYLNIRNDSNQTLNVAVLLLDSDWSVSQVMPQKNIGHTMALEPGKNNGIWKVARAFLQPEYEKGFNTFKIFAATAGAVFRVLELPPLDKPLRSVISRAEPLSANYKKEQPVLREIEPVTGLSKEWTVVELTIKLIRAEPF